MTREDAGQAAVLEEQRTSEQRVITEVEEEAGSATAVVVPSPIAVGLEFKTWLGRKARVTRVNHTSVDVVYILGPKRTKRGIMGFASVLECLALEKERSR